MLKTEFGKSWGESSRPKYKMCTSNNRISTLWTVIFTIESLVIVLGNIVTIIVFWRRRSQLKRMCYLLINLSVADLMVGVGNIKNVASEILKITNSSCVASWTENISLDEFFACASITFLVLISLERMYAIVWPFRIRATSTRTYIYSIGVVWLISGISAGLQLLLKSSKTVFIWFSSIYMFLCLITILSAYSIIWFCSNKEDPRLPLNRHKGNKELAKTLFIVTLFSVITWLPLSVVYIVGLQYTLEGVTGAVIFNVARCLQLANSFINPVVYCFRMPLFRSTLRTMFSKKTTTGLRVHCSEHQTYAEPNNVPILLSVQTLNVDKTI